jgi:hypothetical protein
MLCLRRVDVSHVTPNSGEDGDGPTRVYDPVLGRFLQRDQLPTLLNIIRSTSGNGLGIYQGTIFQDTILTNLVRNLGGENLYIYASANPVNRVDPTGFDDGDIDVFTAPVTITLGDGIKYTFSAADLNYAVAAIYAEAASDQGDQADVASVLLNRIGANNLSGGVKSSFYEVLNAPNQFQAVTGPAKDRTKFEEARTHCTALPKTKEKTGKYIPIGIRRRWPNTIHPLLS